MPNRFMSAWMVVCVGAGVGLVTAQRHMLAHDDDTLALVAANDSGIVRTVNVNGAIDLTNPFFKSLGTNGRSCFSCHRPAQGWSLTPESVRRRFDESRALDLTQQERQAIVAFETGLFTAQVWDRDAGLLRDDGALGGPVALSQQPFFIGINDPVGLNPTNAPFDPRAFTIYTAWSTQNDR